MKISILSNTLPAEYALSELVRILNTTGNSTEVVTSSDESSVLLLGTFSDFNEITPLKSEYDVIDDEIYINVENGHGIIAGLNPRSLLIAVYRYLTELGCRFISVGPEGEYLPQFDAESANVSLHEAPSYRHRGVCIEGATSVENVIDMIDLLPKLGMNAYYIQFREAYTFFDRWYQHRLNPLLENPAPYPVENARAHVETLTREMEKRGILHHAVGHGWTCEPFGVPGLAWEKWDGVASDDVMSKLALVDGKREFFGGIPLNTNLCYGNPEVRSAMIHDICKYIKKYPTKEVIHVWLGDGFNNQCECEICAEKTPSDWYVVLLNELDEELNRQGLDTKIVFLLYNELLWPALHEKIKNQKRFILMFAPISRTYRKSFKTDKTLPPLDEFKLNKIVRPVSIESNLAHLAAWQKDFDGDSFDYDYHFMWRHLHDPGYMNISRILHEDIAGLHNIGIDGYISCQVSRAQFPTGLGIVTMGKALWNKTIAWNDIVEDYFMHTYGERWNVALSYLTKISDSYYAINMEQKIEPDSARADLCRELIAYLENVEFADDSLYWNYLKIHRDIVLDFTNFLLLIFTDRRDESKKFWDEFKTKLFTLEPEFCRVFDPWNLVNLFEHSPDLELM